MLLFKEEDGIEKELIIVMQQKWERRSNDVLVLMMYRFCLCIDDLDFFILTPLCWLTVLVV